MKRDEKKPKQQVISAMIEEPSQQIGYNHSTYIKLKRN